MSHPPVQLLVEKVASLLHPTHRHRDTNGTIKALCSIQFLPYILQGTAINEQGVIDLAALKDTPEGQLDAALRLRDDAREAIGYLWLKGFADPTDEQRLCTARLVPHFTRAVEITGISKTGIKAAYLKSKQGM